MANEPKPRAAKKQNHQTIPTRDFLSCREVLNFIAFRQVSDANLVTWPDSNDCDEGLLMALEALEDGRAFRPDDGRPLPSYVELEARARRLVERTGNTAADLAKAMKPKVDAREWEQKQRRPEWEDAKSKLSAAIADGLQTHMPAGAAYKGRASPDYVLRLELSDTNIGAGWYRSIDVLRLWPEPDKGGPSQEEVKSRLLAICQKCLRDGKPLPKQSEVKKASYAKLNLGGATTNQAQAAFRALPPEYKSPQGRR